MPLQLTHTTSGYWLRDIATAGKLLPRRCKVFDKPLLYTFYGRAAYRQARDEVPANIVTLFPVVFIIDPNKLPQPHQIYPFDSGAFADGAFANHHDEFVLLEDFELTAEIETAPRIVAAIFKDNTSYLENQIRTDLNVTDNDNFEALNYLRILLAPGQKSNVSDKLVDDRSSAIEIAYNVPIPLKGSVVAAIVPEDLADGKRTGLKLKSLGIEVFPYKWTRGTAPKETYGTIRELVRGIYSKLGYL